MLIQKKNKIQQEALQAWLDVGKIGTTEIITGLGKTFIALHALYTMPKDDKVHLFLAEVVDRQKDLTEDIKKYNRIFNRNVLKDYNLIFKTYQSVYKWENKSFGLVIGDEIHDSLTPAYSQFYFNNKYDALIGLSALIDTKTYYEETNRTKGWYLNQIAPICYKYYLDQGLKEKTTRKLNIYIINNELDHINKNIRAGSKTKPFMQTELKSYQYWDSTFKKSMFIKDEKLRDLKVRIAVSRRSDLLYNLPSKIKATKELLKHIKGKTILFSNSIDSLEAITPNVVSSRNKDDVNTNIRNAFEEGKLNLIGSFKKLKQGANLDGLDNAILMSYYSKEKDLIQRLGRLRDNGKVGNVFIFVTRMTQEETWYKRMFKNINNYNFIYCNDVNECIKKIKNNGRTINNI